ncbi:MAG: cupin domain-containing protein [Candidatus Omnitrophota bacterium]
MDQIKIEQVDNEKLKEMGVSEWPIWEKEISRFDWSYDFTEVCYILEGDVTVEVSGGQKVTFGAGDLVTFPKGLKCAWDIRKAVRKHYIFK